MLYTKEVLKVYDKIRALNTEIPVVIERVPVFKEEVYGIYIYMKDAIEKLRKTTYDSSIEHAYRKYLVDKYGYVDGVHYRGVPQDLHTPRSLHTFRICLYILRDGARTDNEKQFYNKLYDITKDCITTEYLNSKFPPTDIYNPVKYGLSENYKPSYSHIQGLYSGTEPAEVKHSLYEVYLMLLFKQPFNAWIRLLEKDISIPQEIHTTENSLMDRLVSLNDIYNILNLIISRNRPPAAAPAKYLKDVLDNMFGIGTIYTPLLGENIEEPSSSNECTTTPFPSDPLDIRTEKTGKAIEAAKELIKLLDKRDKTQVALDNMNSRIADLQRLIYNDGKLVVNEPVDNEKAPTWIGKNIFILPDGTGISGKYANLALFEMGFQYPSGGGWVPYDKFNTYRYCRLATRDMLRTSGSVEMQEWYLWTEEAISLMRFEWTKIRDSINFREVELKKLKFRKPNSLEIDGENEEMTLV